MPNRLACQGLGPTGKGHGALLLIVVLAVGAGGGGGGALGASVETGSELASFVLLGRLVLSGTAGDDVSAKGAATASASVTGVDFVLVRRLGRLRLAAGARAASVVTLAFVGVVPVTSGMGVGWSFALVAVAEAAGGAFLVAPVLEEVEAMMLKERLKNQ